MGEANLHSLRDLLRKLMRVGVWPEEIGKRLQYAEAHVIYCAFLLYAGSPACRPQPITSTGDIFLAWRQVGSWCRLQHGKLNKLAFLESSPISRFFVVRPSMLWHMILDYGKLRRLLQYFSQITLFHHPRKWWAIDVTAHTLAHRHSS